MQKICRQCKRTFEQYPSKSGFCSKSCYNIWRKISINTPNYKGGKIKVYCKVCNKEYFVNKARLKTTVACSYPCYYEWRKIKYSKENHPNWKGGKGASYTWSKEWCELRLYILKRDKYKCQQCGCTNKSSLEIHHIIPYNEVQNHFFLITLCRSCHTKIHRNYLK